MWPFSRAHCFPEGLGSVRKELGENDCRGGSQQALTQKGKELSRRKKVVRCIR